MSKMRVSGTYEDMFKLDFLTPGSEKYGNIEELERRITNAERLGILDLPCVEHTFKWSQAEIARRRQRKQLRAIRRRRRN